MTGARELQYYVAYLPLAQDYIQFKNLYPCHIRSFRRSRSTQTGSDLPSNREHPLVSEVAELQILISVMGETSHFK
jgi:hypothetical protein